MWQGIIILGILSFLWILYRNKRYKKKYTDPFREMIVNLFFVYLVSVVFLTMQPFQWNLPFGIWGGKTIYHFDFNLFYELKNMSNPKLQLLYSVGNIALFVPFGFFIPLLFQHCQRLWVILLLGFLASLTIELIQTFFTMTRRGTLDDLVFNTSGAVIGYSLYMIIKIVVKKMPVSIYIAKH
ncbi:VanZ family protein [Lederbergia galactosidilytica]|uniref:VanZ family protein n=1 Tax=Lederbergia galactosidilytica TaxID=217031 RepID=UPI0007173741|nr:VanZ family protein [Lederbergia galactosidilytica]MBP1917313.1 glycopeptide antibiotics resistance protein [Lederbergia galactosidilytica]